MSNAEVRVSVGSTGDVPLSLLRQYGMFEVPLDITFILKDGTIEPHSDDGSFTLDNLFQRVSETGVIPKTAAPGPGVFMKIWSQYEGPIFPITAGHELSACYASAHAARNILLTRTDGPQRNNIEEPWEGLGLSLGEGFPAIIAAEQFEQGASVQEVRKTLDEVRLKTYVTALSESTEYFALSGKISGIQAWMGQVLHVKPCVIINEKGMIVPFRKYRTYGEAFKDLAEWAAENGPIERMAILHTGNEQVALDMRKAVEDINLFDPKNIIIAPTRRVIASHVGKNSIGFEFIGKKRGDIYVRPPR